MPTLVSSRASSLHGCPQEGAAPSSTPASSSMPPTYTSSAARAARRKGAPGRPAPPLLIKRRQPDRRGFEIPRPPVLPRHRKDLIADEHLPALPNSRKSPPPVRPCGPLTAATSSRLTTPWCGPAGVGAARTSAVVGGRSGVAPQVQGRHGDMGMTRGRQGRREEEEEVGVGVGKYKQKG
jgi:hypothetical protein